MTNLRKQIKGKLVAAQNDCARLLDNAYAVISFYLPDDIELDKMTEDLTELFINIAERPDISMYDFYLELKKHGKIVDLGVHYKYILKCYSVILIASDLQDNLLGIYNET